MRFIAHIATRFPALAGIGTFVRGPHGRKSDVIRSTATDHLGVAFRALGACTVALGLASAAPASADTPRHISAANELRLCLWEKDGLRSAVRAGELHRGIERYRSETMWALTEIEPNLYRVTRAKPSGLTAEIKLPDETGAAHCLLFGPNLQTGDAALAADTFVEFGFMKGFAPAQAREGTQRRYVAADIPFSLELVAYHAEGFGDVVGLFFNGLNNVPVSRQLTAGRSDVPRDTVRAYVAWALQTCVLNLGNEDWMRSAIEKGGFVYGWPEGGSSGQHVYFLPDNSVSAGVSGHACDIETNYVGVTETLHLTRNTLNSAFPGQFSESQTSNSSRGNCSSFYKTGGNPPVVIYVENLDAGATNTCFESGASRIRFEIPG